MAPRSALHGWRESDLNPPPPGFSGAMRGNTLFETYAHGMTRAPVAVSVKAGMRTVGVFFHGECLKARACCSRCRPDIRSR